MAFPNTRHSAILGLHDEDADVRRQSLDALVCAYWEPMRTYLRLRWRESEENAADLAQAFFSKCIESAIFARYEKSKGTFRTYIRTCLDNFVLNNRKKAHASAAPLEVDVASADDSPEDVFDREWVRSLFSLAIDDLRVSQDAVRFRVFERYNLNDSDTRPSYNELAAEFGVTTVSITNYLAAMRREFRKVVLSRLRALTRSEREFRSEARAILGIEI